ncbi:succinate dehydrogenase assembly factor 2 [Pseudooceanicola sp.]|uniref:succinate dehydrogenase assembly factor 2 n=1 Tax=Pseudooceanicola sp. TaxID=1914328 RepID=UPI00260C214F|nr:succinate dehydrogenase assembly factor 2 [Pseudooceanicola sp.]MDF1853986.1 succinate dehydrogenase assembly factor 2 [Pseudooceanicola sp.]
MSESHEDRLKRLRMRSMRRGIKEMDILLSRFADAELATLSEAELTTYDALLWENDQDLLVWVTGQQAAPAQYHPLIARIMAGPAAAGGG